MTGLRRADCTSAGRFAFGIPTASTSHASRAGLAAQRVRPAAVRARRLCVMGRTVSPPTILGAFVGVKIRRASSPLGPWLLDEPGGRGVKSCRAPFNPSGCSTRPLVHFLRKLPTKQRVTGAAAVICRRTERPSPRAKRGYACLAVGTRLYNPGPRVAGRQSEIRWFQRGALPAPAGVAALPRTDNGLRTNSG